MVGCASFARADHEPDDRVLPHVHQARDGPDRIALTEEVQDLGSIGGGQLVHGVHMDPCTAQVKHFSMFAKF